MPAGAMACWAWTETWLRHFGDRVEHRFVVGEAGDGPCGMALLTLGRQRPAVIGLRRLALGTVGAPDVYLEYNRLLARPDRRADFAAAMLRICDEDRGWEELGLDGLTIPDAEAFVAADPGLSVQRFPSPTADLPALAGTHGDVVAGLPGRVRRRLERTRAALAPLEAELIDDPAAAEPAVAELAELHQARWRDGPRGGLLKHASTIAFHRDAIRALMPERALLFRLRSAGRTLGCVYGFVEQDRFLFYVSGVRRLEDPRLVPGLLTHASFMQGCFERGIREYDFLAGSERYKRELSNGESTLVWLTRRRRRVRGVVRQGAIRVKRLATRR